MLGLLTSLALVLPVHGATWEGVTWSSAGEAPDLAKDPETGQIHLAWLSGGRANHAVFRSDGTLVESEDRAEWSGEGDGWSFGPGIAVGPGSEVYLSFKSGVEGWVYSTWLAIRSSGTWRAPVALQPAAERGYGSQVAADELGATVVVERADETPYGAMSHWTVRGGSLVGSGDLTDARVDDRVDIVAGLQSGERHAFAGYPNPGGHIFYAWSDDGGSSWHGGDAIESSSCRGGRNGQPDAAVDAEGRVHLVYGCSEDEQVGGPSVRHAILSGHSVVSDAPVTQSGDLSEWHLSLGISRVATLGRDDVVVAWLTDDEGELYASHSQDGGDTWLEPVRIGDKGGDAEGRNAPALVATGNVLFLAWSDGGTVYLARGEVDLTPDEEDPGDSGDPDEPDTGDPAAGDDTGESADDLPPDPEPIDCGEDEGWGCSASPTGGALWWVGGLLVGWRRRSG